MNLKPSQIVTMASGAVLLIFSFLAFIKIDAGPFGDDKSFSAWSGDLFAPLSTWPALIGVIVAGAVAARAFGNVSLPENVIGFSIDQLLGGLAAAGFLIMFGFLIQGSDASWGIGFWFMLLGSIGLVAGCVMELLGIQPGTPASGGGQPFGGMPPQGPPPGGMPPQGPPPGGMPPQNPPGSF